MGLGAVLGSNAGCRTGLERSPPSHFRPSADYALLYVWALLPSPETITELEKVKTSGLYHDVSIVKISPGVVVKFGTHIDFIETKNMIYVAENTEIPVPRVFAFSYHGPVDRGALLRRTV
jgi:hypothetical protein